MTGSNDDFLARLREEEAARLGRDVGQRDYRATDPMVRYLRCDCGKADCWIAGLLPLRDHIAGLYQAILALGWAERFPGLDRQDEAWPGVTYALQMAGGIRDLTCDPSNVTGDESAFWCESAADRQDEDTELASKYAAALVTFNFAWSAYEAAIEITSAGDPIRDKLPVHARKIFQAEATSASQLRCLAQHTGYARWWCNRVDHLRSELVRTIDGYELKGAAAAAELVRVFRNYVVHGQDVLPAESVAPCYRFYAVTRVLLLLIQHLVWRKVRQPSRPLHISAMYEELGREPATVFLRNLHYEDDVWRTMKPKRSRNGVRTNRWF